MTTSSYPFLFNTKNKRPRMMRHVPQHHQYNHINHREKHNYNSKLLSVIPKKHKKKLFKLCAFLIILSIVNLWWGSGSSLSLDNDDVVTAVGGGGDGNSDVEYVSNSRKNHVVVSAASIALDNFVTSSTTTTTKEMEDSTIREENKFGMVEKLKATSMEENLRQEEEEKIESQKITSMEENERQGEEEEEDYQTIHQKEEEEDTPEEQFPNIENENSPEKETQKHQHKNTHRNIKSQSPSSSLNCVPYGGPSDASDMVYWKDIPSDQSSSFTSPFYSSQKEKFLTFEPDAGGWNNIRMGMETVLVMAVAMGRTLVLPPPNEIYLLDHKQKSQKTEFGFSDFFDLDSLTSKYPNLKIISMEQFLTNPSITNQLDDQRPPSNHNTIVTPPNSNSGHKEIFTYLRTMGYTRYWFPESCIVAFPSTNHPQNVHTLHKLMDEIWSERSQPLPHPNDYRDNPTPVNSSPLQRLRELLGLRTQLCVYDDALQNQTLIHFPTRKTTHYEESSVRFRLLANFYTFIFFEDFRMDLWMKRFIRDNVRYRDEIQCAAARIVNAIRTQHQSTTNNNSNDFYTMHVRRNDFQYENVFISAQQIYKTAIHRYIPNNATLYIATDESDLSFFNDLRKYYNVVFLNDYKHLMDGDGGGLEMNPNYYGMIDQLVASQGKVFSGTWYSTFTSYINRIRGYHTTKQHSSSTTTTIEETTQTGILESYHHVPIRHVDQMREYRAVSIPAWKREYPVAWRDIDFDVPTFMEDRDHDNQDVDI